VSYRVCLKHSAEKELSRISTENQTRVAVALLSLSENPLPAGCKKLKGSNAFRVRVGDYRIVYTVDHEDATVTVFAIGHRRQVYRR
jgi:mRNA interferase RelE/StbE